MPGFWSKQLLVVGNTNNHHDVPKNKADDEINAFVNIFGTS